MKQQFPPSGECASCKGQCCRTSAGAYLPEDLRDLSVTAVKNMVLAGKASIGVWEHPDETIQPWTSRWMLYLRPAHKGMEGQAYDPSWGGACVHHTETGCALSFEDRPSQCRALEPGCGCKQHLEMREVVEAWLPRQNLLKLVKKVSG